MSLNNQNILRLPGYIPNSEWSTRNFSSYSGAWAANLSVVVKAAGGARVKNVVTGWIVSQMAGATALVTFAYLTNGTIAGNPSNLEGLGHMELTSPINTAINYSWVFEADDPLIGDLNSNISFKTTSGGVAGAGLQVMVKGYQIAA